MSREERVEKLRHLITCMKCEVSGKCCDDNCPTQYYAGNMGEIIENLEEIAKALEQQPCEDVISSEAVNTLVDELARAISDERCWISRGRSTATIMQDILDLPSVTPQPKIGKWIDDKCSICGKGIEDLIDSPEWYENERLNFCPFCGVKIEAESEEK